MRLTSSRGRHCSREPFKKVSRRLQSPFIIVFVMAWKTNGALYEHIQHCVKEIKDLTGLLSSAEHLQNVLMLMIKDPNPLEDDNVQDAQLRGEDGYGAGDSNTTASATTGKANTYKLTYINSGFLTLSPSFHITPVCTTTVALHRNVSTPRFVFSIGDAADEPSGIDDAPVYGLAPKTSQGLPYSESAEQSVSAHLKSFILVCHQTASRPCFLYRKG